MGWVWRDDEPDDMKSPPGDVRKFENPNPRSADDRCTTRKVVRSQCKTEEVEPGKFVRKCEKTEELLRDCFGRPVEVLQSNKEYTEDDVTDRVLKGSFPSESSEQGALDFPGLCSDIDAIERSFNFPGLQTDIQAIERSIFGGLSRFFEAAEDMKGGFFSAFGFPHVFDENSSSSSASQRLGVPIESDPQQEAFDKRHKPDTGHVDLSGLARDV